MWYLTFQSSCLTSKLFSGQATQTLNIAVNKTATQRSQYANQPPGLAVDGSILEQPSLPGIYRDEQFSHTLELYDQWWKVDLGAGYYIYRVEMSSRQGYGM